MWQLGRLREQHPRAGACLAQASWCEGRRVGSRRPRREQDSVNVLAMPGQGMSGDLGSCQVSPHVWSSLSGE